MNLEAYARLLVTKGVNIQKDQILMITADIATADLVRACAKEAFRLGAKDVIPLFADEVITRERYMHNDADYLTNIPAYISSYYNDYADQGAAILTITSEDPGLMKDVDAAKITARSAAMHQVCEPFYTGLDTGRNRWCIAGAPSLAWANRVFPEMSDKEAMEALWNAILHTSRADGEDPGAAWEAHRHAFEERVNRLNAMGIKELHYHTGLGTDLVIGMNPDYVFWGGGSYDRNGIYYFPNIPTEEIYTTPDFHKVNGTAVSSKPLNYGGQLIEDFWIRFENGRAVDWDAKAGRDTLTQIIETDEGSHYLGEAALVPFDSPISNTGILFYNTLYDENAACHLALGKGFGECVKDGLTLSKDELKARGVNDSLTHVDFMIGTKETKIDAVLADGSTVPVFADGNFVF